MHYNYYTKIVHDDPNSNRSMYMLECNQICNSINNVDYCHDNYCNYRISKDTYEKIQNKDIVWAVQHLQDPINATKIAAKIIIKNEIYT